MELGIHGSYERLNSDGTTTIVDGMNNTSTDQYNGRKVLFQATDPLGAKTSQLYDANFRPAMIVDTTGETTNLQWSGDGADLTQIVDTKGGQADLTYDADHNLTSLVDQRDFLTTYTYNGTHLTSSLDTLNGETTYTYTAQG